MAPYWQADDIFFEVLRDNDVLTTMVVEVAGEVIASANVREKGKVLKAIGNGASIRPPLASGRKSHAAFLNR